VKRISTILIFLLASILLVTLIFFGGWAWDDHREKMQAHALVEQLESYKAVHSKYPDDLTPFRKNTIDNLSYAPDPARQSFTLSYIIGITTNHVEQYSSTTHKWEKIF
jgi:hypothetical protein